MIEHLPDIGVTIISNWIYNCYLIHDGGDGRPFVVDPGTPMAARAMLDELVAHGSHPAELFAAAATHGHADHVGGMPSLRAEMARTNLSIAMWLPSGIADLLAGAPRRSPGPREIAHILPVMADQPFELAPMKELAQTLKEIGYDGKGIRFPFIPDEWLRDGDRLDGAPDWEVLYTPGHTDDSISFYNAKKRTLLSGDAVLAVNRQAWFNPEFVDAELSASTESRLRALDVEYMLPGHGRAVAGNHVMAEALSFNERPPDSGAVASIRRLFTGHAHAARHAARHN